MRKLRLVIVIAAAIGLFAASAESSDDKIMMEITQALDKIQTKLNKNPSNKQVAEEQLKELEKLREAHSASDEFNEEGILDWYSALEAQALKVSQQKISKTLKTLKVGENIGKLEIEYTGHGGQVRLFFVTVGILKYAVSQSSTTGAEARFEEEITKIAKASGLKRTSPDDLNGKKVIFKINKRGDKLTYRGVTYPTVRITSFLKG